MSTTYTASGSVRGDCGHQHRTILAAVKCQRADNRACKRAGGQSAHTDRYVMIVEDGERRGFVDDDEYQELLDAERLLDDIEAGLVVR